MEDVKLGFIGAGNIARAIIGGLISHGHAPSLIYAADPSAHQLAQLPDDIQKLSANHRLVEQVDVVVICVKPDLVIPVATDFAPLARDKLIVSVAAGVTTASIAGALGQDAAIIRCMPNTPALVQTGMTGLYANGNVHDQQKEIGRSMLAAVGKTAWLESEADLDIVTAVSGSGPAYFFLVMEAMEAAATRLGLSTEMARTLVLQTALGAARMAIGSDDEAATLRHNVTSKGGTTEAAINTLLDAGLPEDFDRAIEAAYRRSIELSGT
ncbi:MAG: pyrroline-5-carboxylate reductase [Pseudomonadales bacterium]